MQHFGAPTRLLDWTVSPYVALYFAVSDLASVPGAIWLFHAGKLFQELKKQFPGRQIPPIPSDYSDLFFDSNSPEVCFPFTLPRYNERMARQSGRFTVCGRILSNHGDMIENILCYLPTNVLKLIILDTLKHPFLKRLRYMQINSSTLFPGLDGLGKMIKEFVSIESRCQ